MSYDDFVSEASEFIDIDDFAVKATLDGVAINGIPGFGPAEDIDGFESNMPTFTIAESRDNKPAHGSTLIHGGDTYLVREVRDDGTGIMVLMLEAQ